jgi:hypothetical protein
MKFIVSDSKRWGARGNGIRWGILCTDSNGTQSLYQIDRCHFYIADYKEQARLYLIKLDPHMRKAWKMKVVKLQEAYHLAS